MKRDISHPFICSVNPCKPPNLPETDVDVIAPRLVPTAPRAARMGVRVSAPLRRGAAPYADGSLSSQTPSHLIFLSILGVPEEFSPEFYIEFCVRQGTIKSTG